MIDAHFANGRPVTRIPEITKTGGLLAAIVLHNLIYPLSTVGGVGPLIIPIGFYAQAFAAFEAIIGTLYTVILLSRLVGLHATQLNET